MFKEYYLYLLENIIFQDKMLIENDKNLKKINKNTIEFNQSFNERILNVENKLDKYIDRINTLNILMVGIFFLQVCIMLRIF